MPWNLFSDCLVVIEVTLYQSWEVIAKVQTVLRVKYVEVVVRVAG